VPVNAADSFSVVVSMLRITAPQVSFAFFVALQLNFMLF
jgi:hypothetical protein